MPADPSLVAALEQALAADPTADAVRTHLVRVLLDGDEPARAWLACEPLVAAHPDDLDVLRLAAEAARASGRLESAETYERLIDLLGGAPGSPESGLAANVGDEQTVPEGIDAFLADVLREHAEQSVTLADVGGLDGVKAQINRSFLAPLRNPELRMAYGKSLRGGLLLWGPPGCGKTFLARAIAGELGASFLPVGLYEVLDMWLGNSERNLHGVFEAARRARPAVVFFDEVDALGFSRTQQRGASTRNLVATLLTELDGIGNDNESVFVLAATNQPWDVDPALRRPGRFDRTILVLPPDAPAREAILRLNLRNRPVESVDISALARRTDGYSGSDLRLLCEVATEQAFEEAERSGDLLPITQRHFDVATREVEPSVGAWFDGAKNYISYANDNGEYDELAKYLRRRPRR